MNTTIKRVTIGTRTVNGTEWAVEHLAQRVVSAGPLQWVLVKSLCNGVPSGSETFRTKRELMAAFEAIVSP